MPIFFEIKSGVYYDSITLLKLQKQLLQYQGIQNSAVVMATEVNKTILQQVQLWSQEIAKATAEDLVISICADNEENAKKALQLVWETLHQSKIHTQNQGYRPRTITSAQKMLPNANLVLISVPGKFAAEQARIGLENNLHVMLFSDNVTIEDEVQLKQLAKERGLLVMGPDCGTAIINGVGLGFANAVRRGGIGIIGASGTGIQEVTCLIHSFGAGISCAIGTGGRDLSREVGGITMLQALSALENDPKTQIIILISKPPHPEVMQKVILAANQVKKPIILCFLGAEHLSYPQPMQKTVIFVNTLSETAKIAVKAWQKIQAGIIPTKENIQDETSSAPKIATSKNEGIFDSIGSALSRVDTAVGHVAKKVTTEIASWVIDNVSQANIKNTLISSGPFVESWNLQKWQETIQAEKATRHPKQQYLRGIYSGGTLAYETIFLLKSKIPALYSNLSKEQQYRLSDPTKSYQHTIIDLGEDEYTVGRPHPMIDNTFRCQRLLQEANDPETAVILFDLVLGYGSQLDILSLFIPTLQQAIQQMDLQQRNIAFVSHICGTTDDPQNLLHIAQELTKIGVHCALSNETAALLAVALL